MLMKSIEIKELKELKYSLFQEHSLNCEIKKKITKKQHAYSGINITKKTNFTCF